MIMLLSQFCLTLGFLLMLVQISIRGVIMVVLYFHGFCWEFAVEFRQGFIVLKTFRRHVI